MDSESRLQSECFIWFHNNYPEYRGLLCYNLNNSKNRIDGARNKALGLQAGRSDMVLYYSGRATMIEFKTEIGKQSKKQIEWQKTVETNGFEYVIVINFNCFKEFIIKTLQI